MTQMNAPLENQAVRASRTGGRMLEGKCAVVFGASGSIGAAVAREFAAEGARVFLAGRTKSALEAVAKQIGAETSTVDVLDDTAVNQYLDSVLHVRDGAALNRAGGSIGDSLPAVVAVTVLVEAVAR